MVVRRELRSISENHNAASVAVKSSRRKVFWYDRAGVIRRHAGVGRFVLGFVLIVGVARTQGGKLGGEDCVCDLAVSFSEPQFYPKH
jgi:hypothetical protein